MAAPDRAGARARTSIMERMSIGARATCVDIECRRRGIGLIRALPSLASNEGTSLSTPMEIDMNTSSAKFRRTAFAAAMIGFAVCQPASAQFLGGVVVASGDVDGDGAAASSVKKHWDVKSNTAGVIDTNWFNPANWSPYGVPGPTDTVVLDGRDRVVIDPSRNDTGYSKVTFGDLVISSVAVLETLPGSIVENRATLVLDQGQLIHRGSGAAGESLIAGGSSDPAGSAPSISEIVVTKVVLNPTAQSKRTSVLKSFATLDVGLGGTEPAALIKTGPGTLRLAAGPGHYATLNTDTLVIEGDLRISTYYGFSPRPGQTFRIATVNGTRSGEFIGLPEGGYVGCTEDNVGLRMSYQGGDGNDLVISAEATDPATCLLLPAVQKVREAAARTTSTPTATLGLVADIGGTTAGLLLPAIQKVREAAATTEETAARMLNNKNPELTR
ncbi:MAG: hypothetical protein K0Q76_2884 [Panacagrimonas sp.]|jgi:hypothetical protein|nr:hypothetical protein [Panacagrimonas sp.]